MKQIITKIYIMGISKKHYSVVEFPAWIEFNEWLDKCTWQMFYRERYRTYSEGELKENFPYAPNGFRCCFCEVAPVKFFNGFGRLAIVIEVRTIWTDQPAIVKINNDLK
jgi:hypothetical protein